MNFSHALDLLDYAGKTDRLHLLFAQLKKDYERANVPFPLHGFKPEEPDYSALLQALHENLYFLLMERFDQYLNLMYAADVPERSFKGIHGTDTVEVASQVTLLLLKREWKKIEFRTR